MFVLVRIDRLPSQLFVSGVFIRSLVRAQGGADIDHVRPGLIRKESAAG
jgi:hypothetical protein